MSLASDDNLGPPATETPVAERHRGATMKHVDPGQVSCSVARTWAVL